jgi:phosphoribosyl 1,2-cyclic phosphodiesterase
MKFQQYYSSSRGNLYTVTAASGKRLLLECGAPWQKLQKALHFDLSNIDGCVLTHEHADHSKAVEDVMRAGINVYSSPGTFEALGLLRKHRRARTVANGIFRASKDFTVLSFSIPHDAKEPYGYVVHEVGTEEYLFFCPDSAFIKQRFNIKFSIIAIECSFDKDILQKRVDTKDINETLAKRLLTSHQEKQVAMRYVADFCDLSRCREIHLLHMGGGNINKKQTKQEFEERFFIETIFI